MTQIHWKSAVNGFFDDPSDWTTSHVPGASDEAVLDAPVGRYTVVCKSGILGLALGGTQRVGSIQTASNATLEIVGDIDVLDLLAGSTSFRAFDGTGGGANAGTIIVQDATFVVPILGSLLGASAALEISGVFDNTGRIVLNGRPQLLGLLGADQSTLLKVLGAATLTGAGHVVMSNEKLNVIEGDPGASLTNVDNIISGSGIIEHVSFTNQAAGVIDANQTEGLVLAATGTFTNRGLLEGSGVGVLIATGVIDNSGGGVIEANAGRVALQGVEVIGGVVESVGKGFVEANIKGGVLDGAGESITLAGLIIVKDGADLTLEGAVDNTGDLIVDSSSRFPTLQTDLIIGSGGATLSGGGQIVLTALPVNQIRGLTAGETLTNVDNRIIGAGQLGGGVLTLVNQSKGAIIGTGLAGLIIDTGVNLIVNDGLIAATRGGVTTIDSAISNDGVLAVDGGVLTVNAAVSGSGRGVINGGTLILASTFSQKVTFGATGILELGQSQTYSGTVYGFSTADETSLDLRDIAFAGAGEATFSGTATGGALTVTDGSHTAIIRLAGDYLGSSFTASSDGQGGTMVVDPPRSAASRMRFIAAAAIVGAVPPGPTSGMFEAHRSSPPTLVAPRAQIP